jgi:hypothetical protein
LKGLIYNKRGETLVESVCAMAVLLIAALTFIAAFGYAVKLLEAANKNDADRYTEFTASEGGTVELRIVVDGAVFKESAQILKNSAGLVFLKGAEDE